MINRILIRNKVVQLLYSYLLTKSEFKIESAPESPTKEKRFSYYIYQETILFLLKLTQHNITGKNNNPLSGISLSHVFSKSKIMDSLFSEEKIKVLILKHDKESEPFSNSLIPVYKDIINSSIYRSFVRDKNPDLKKEVSFWTTTIKTIIAKNQEFINDARQNPDYSISGFEKGIEMTVDTIDSYSDNQFMLSNAERDLKYSLNKAYELYHALLLLPVEITKMRARQLDNAKHKYLPTDDDLNPNTRFIDNEFPLLIKESNSISEYLKNNPFSWATDEDFIKRLLELVMQSEIYNEYMNLSVTDRAIDCDFWRKIMKNVILPSDDLAEILESKSVYWNDDLDIIGTFVIKTIKQAGRSESNQIDILPQYKDHEDFEFGMTLFKLAADNYNEYKGYVEKFVNSSTWDPERIAFMDLVIMVAAIAEILNFPTIALAVSINEYIEIANSYSTSRSGQFINGVLFSITNWLREEGKLIGK